jgi:predicted transcriptional regulator
LYLVPSDTGDDLDPQERAELHQAIEESERELDAGKVVSEEEIGAMLQAIK